MKVEEEVAICLLCEKREFLSSNKTQSEESEALFKSSLGFERSCLSSRCLYAVCVWCFAIRMNLTEHKTRKMFFLKFYQVFMMKSATHQLYLALNNDERVSFCTSSVSPHRVATLMQMHFFLSSHSHHFCTLSTFTLIHLLSHKSHHCIYAYYWVLSRVMKKPKHCWCMQSEKHISFFTSF